MLTCPPTLHTRRPSPTTIEYTVSTRPPLTLPLRIILTITHAIRITLALAIILLLYTTYLTHVPRPTLLTSLPLPLSMRIPSPLQTLSASLPPPLLLPLSLGALTLCVLRPHTTESLLLLRHLGLQISSSPKTYLSTTKTRFIPSEKVQDIYINEVFRNFEVRYVLVVVVEGEGELLVVFERLLPGRRVLERVWRGGRRGLFGGEEAVANGNGNGGVGVGGGGKDGEGEERL